MVAKRDDDLAGEAYHGGALSSNVPAEKYVLGCFSVHWHGAERGSLTISHTDDPERIVWANVPKVSFLTAALGQSTVHESRGFFKIRDKLNSTAREQVIKIISQDGDTLLLEGSFADVANSIWRFEMRCLDDRQLALEASATFDGKSCNRLCLCAASCAQEEMYGFGAQFTQLHMKGHRVPVISQEPGIGRGIQPLTRVMEKLFQAGGAWWNSYAPVPMFISTELRAFCLENTEYSVFDLSPSDSFRVGALAEHLQARIFFGSSPLDVLEAYTRFCGRMRPLPAWAHRGAIIGMQGGSAKVRKTLQQLEEHRAHVAGFWLQDWVGKRKTAIGSQLWWSWEVDTCQYPGWDELVDQLRQKSIRVLTYLNPFIVDASQHRTLKHNLYQEAVENRYFIQSSDGSPYKIMNTTFSASMVDLTNGKCREFVKRVIKQNLLDTGSSGWMADYAEALPFDAKLSGGQDAASYHNEYPIEWAKVNREAITEAGLEDDTLFFTRSGYHRSPGYTTCFWLGDHLTSWRQEDGIKSVVVGLLSSGLSGMSINHADIGGYTTTAVLPVRIPSITFARSQELMLRWIEMSAFTPVFRSHEGNVPHRNHQITDHAKTLAHFARFSRVYAALADYRKQLCLQASEFGYPLVRHPWLHYPNDLQVRELKLQFLLGADFMVAPVLDPDVDAVRLYLPEGKWIHLWSGQEVAVCGPRGKWFKCSAPIGAPPLFYHSASQAGKALSDTLAANGDKGASWSSSAFWLDDETSNVSRSKSWCCCRRRRQPKTVPHDSASRKKEAWGTGDQELE